MLVLAFGALFCALFGGFFPSLTKLVKAWNDVRSATVLKVAYASFFVSMAAVFATPQDSLAYAVAFAAVGLSMCNCIGFAVLYTLASLDEEK